MSPNPRIIIWNLWLNEPEFLNLPFWKRKKNGMEKKWNVKSLSGTTKGCNETDEVCNQAMFLHLLWKEIGFLSCSRIFQNKLFPGFQVFN